MVQRYFAYGLMLLYCVISISLKAQDSITMTQLPVKWDLQTCFEYANKNNIQINSLRLGQKINQQNLFLAKVAKYPNLFGNMGQNLTHSTNANPVVGGYATQSSFSSSYSLTSAWTIYNGGYNNYNIKLENLNLGATTLNIEQTINGLKIQITLDYFNILMAKENIFYVEDLVKTSQAQLDQGNQRYQVGSIAKNALIELQAQNAMDKYTLVSAQNTYRQNVLSLKQLLQLPWQYTMEIAVPDTIIATSLAPSLEEVQRIAMQTRPEIKYAQFAVDIAKMNLKMARAELLPTASIGSTLASGYSNNQTVDYLQQLDHNFYQRIGLTLSIPIFNNQIFRTKIEINKIEIEESKLSFLGAQTTLSQEVEQAYINVLNSQAQYDAAVTELTAGKESYRVANEQYKVGAANLVDLLQQKNLYVQALQAYLQAKYGAALNIAVFVFYQGEPIKL